MRFMFPRLPKNTTNATPTRPYSHPWMRVPIAPRTRSGSRWYVTVNAPRPVSAASKGTARLKATHGTMPVNLVRVPTMIWPQ